MIDSRHRSTLLLVGGVALAYVFTTAVGMWGARVAGIGIPLAPGVVLALGLLFGPIAAGGVAIGHLAASLLSGAFAPETGVGFLTQIAIVVTATGIWGGFGRLSSGERPGVPSGRNVLEYGLVAVTTVAFTGALHAAASILLAARPFRAAVVSFVPGSLASMLTVGGLTLYVGYWLVDRPGMTVSGSIDVAAPATRSNARPTGFRVLGIGAAWCLGGSLVSLVFQSAELKYTHTFINRFGRGSILVLEAAGPAGLNLHLAAAFVFLSGYLYWLANPGDRNA